MAWLVKSPDKNTDLSLWWKFKKKYTMRNLFASKKIYNLLFEKFGTSLMKNWV